MELTIHEILWNLGDDEITRGEKSSDYKKLNFFDFNRNLTAIRSLTTWMIGLIPHME
jgi:hypothetical protein